VDVILFSFILTKSIPFTNLMYMGLFLLILSRNNFATTGMPNDHVSRLFVHLSETVNAISLLFGFSQSHL